jgi:hypothetical protein
MVIPRVIPPAAKGAVLIWMALAAVGASPAAAQSVSSNWAGYVAIPFTAGARSFGSVSGTWTAPAVRCTAGREAFSAVWDGLGGYGERSRALEQIGTEANCSRSGRATYAAWWEIIPAAPVRLPLAVHPGDKITASATVRARGVTLALRDLSTGSRFATTRRASAVDVSSAEWIVEAPSVCRSSGGCATLPLSDFGNVPFSGAYATAAGHNGPVADRTWSNQGIELRQDAILGAGTGQGQRQGATRILVSATPSPLSAGTGSFTVGYEERLSRAETPRLPTFPGLTLPAG